MRHRGVFFINLGLLFFLHVKAQIASNSDAGTLNALHPSLVVVIGIILVIISLTFLLLAYAKFCQRSTHDLFGGNAHPHNFNGLIRSSSTRSGIDQTVIDSLPFFRFSSLKGSKEGLECAVCISRFEDAEILRLLPKCRHAFHTNCIDQWLLSHSSCPICRYKFEPKDLKIFTFSNSLRYLENPSNLTEDPNLEIFVQREEDDRGSSRFNLGSSFQGNQSGENEDFLIEDGKDPDGSRKLLHKFKHKIIVSDIFIKNRWSDVNSSDLLSLNSEMLRVMSSDRLSPSNKSSSRFHIGLSKNENMDKIKVDMEKKRLYESKFNRVERSNSLSNLRVSSNSDDRGSSSKNIHPDEKRSSSEITNFSRFRVLSISNRGKESASPISRAKEERIRRLWLPIARRTVQWFAGRERKPPELECKREESNV